MDKIVVHLVYTLHGGIASVAANLINEQKKLGYKVVVAYVNYSDALEKMVGEKLEYIKLSPPKFPGQTMLFGVGARKIYKEVKKKYPKAEIVNHAHSLQTVGVLANIKNIPMVCTLHGTHGQDKGIRIKLSDKLSDLTIKKLLKHNKSVVAVSDYVREFFKNEKIVTIHNGIEIPEGEKENHEDFTMAHLGNISTAKGFDTSLNGYKMLCSKIGRKVKFVFAGNLHDIDKNELERALSDKDLNLDYKGFVPNASKEILPKADILVLASRNEALGMCLIEGLSYGLPLLGTNIGGIPEVIKDGYNGFLIKDEKELAQKMELLYTDKELYKKLSGNAYNTFLEKFTSENMNEKYVKLYEKQF